MLALRRGAHGNRVTTTPYASLSPDTVLDAVASLGFQPDGRLIPLNSYENRVYQIGMEDAPPLIAKFYREGRWSDETILEEHAFAWELADLEIPVVPPIRSDDSTLHRHAGFRFSAYPHQRGRAPELESAENLEWMGRLVGRIHAAGDTQPFRHRPALDSERFGYEPVRYLLEENQVPEHVRHRYEDISAAVLESVDRCFAQAGDFRRTRTHGDCHLGNVLWADDGPHFVDLDDCMQAPAIQDLWMLLAGDRDTMTGQLEHVLEGYTQFHEFDARELHLVEALRALRMIHYVAWLARRWDDPAFPVAFPWFGASRYWEEHVDQLYEQLERLDQPPLRVAI